MKVKKRGGNRGTDLGKLVADVKGKKAPRGRAVGKSGESYTIKRKARKQANGNRGDAERFTPSDPKGRYRGEVDVTHSEGRTIGQAWTELFVQNEKLYAKLKTRDQVKTDRELSSQMQAWFPGRGSKLLQNVYAVRWRYNTGRLDNRQANAQTTGVISYPYVRDPEGKVHRAKRPIVAFDGVYQDGKRIGDVPLKPSELGKAQGSPQKARKGGKGIKNASQVPRAVDGKLGPRNAVAKKQPRQKAVKVKRVKAPGPQYDKPVQVPGEPISQTPAKRPAKRKGGESLEKFLARDTSRGDTRKNAPPSKASQPKKARRQVAEVVE